MNCVVTKGGFLKSHRLEHEGNTAQDFVFRHWLWSPEHHHLPPFYRSPSAGVRACASRSQGRSAAAVAPCLCLLLVCSYLRFFVACSPPVLQVCVFACLSLQRFHRKLWCEINGKWVLSLFKLFVKDRAVFQYLVLPCCCCWALITRWTFLWKAGHLCAYSFSWCSCWFHSGRLDLLLVSYYSAIAKESVKSLWKDANKLKN